MNCNLPRPVRVTCPSCNSVWRSWHQGFASTFSAVSEIVQFQQVPRQESMLSISDQVQRYLAPSRGVAHPRSKADSPFHPLALTWVRGSLIEIARGVVRAHTPAVMAAKSDDRCLCHLTTLFQRQRLYSIEWLREYGLKGCGRKWQWHISRYPSVCLEVLRKNTGNLGHDNWCQGRGSNLRRPECEAGVPTAIRSTYKLINDVSTVEIVTWN
jgi:hypothetical protein